MHLKFKGNLNIYRLIQFSVSFFFLFLNQVQLTGNFLPNSPSNLNTKNDSTLYYFYEPYPILKGKYLIQIGGPFSILPIPLVEDEYPIPAIDVQFKYCLLQNISLSATLSTNIFATIFHTGLQWNINLRNFSLGVGNNLCWGFGFFSIKEQFDNVTAYVIYYMPYFRIGYRFTEFSISSSFVATYILKI